MVKEEIFDELDSLSDYVKRIENDIDSCPKDYSIGDIIARFEIIKCKIEKLRDDI